MKTSNIVKVALFSSAFLAGSMLFTGCALTSNGTKQKVALSTSNGKPVVADIKGKKVNIPGEVKISRRSGATIKVLAADNPGYEDTEFIIKGKNKLSGWFWGNIIWGGTFGSTTDGAAGSMWKYANPNFTIPVSEKR